MPIARRSSPSPRRSGVAHQPIRTMADSPEARRTRAVPGRDERRREHPTSSARGPSGAAVAPTTSAGPTTHHKREGHRQPQEADTPHEQRGGLDAGVRQFLLVLLHHLGGDRDHVRDLVRLVTGDLHDHLGTVGGIHGHGEDEGCSPAVLVLLVR